MPEAIYKSIALWYACYDKYMKECAMKNQEVDSSLKFFVKCFK